MNFRLLALGRRWIAVHEAGHVIAAQQFGAKATGRIWFKGGCWRGLANIPDVDEMPADQRRIIGLAGAAALMVWLGLAPDRFFSVNVGMSASDWKLVGVVTGRSNVAVIRESLISTMAMFDREALQAVSRRIIVESRWAANGGPPSG